MKARFYGYSILVLGLAALLASCQAPTSPSSPPPSKAWVVSTLAGSSTGTAGIADSTGTSAKFNKPSGVAVDSSGNIYVADTDNNRIRKITIGSFGNGVVSTLAGDGTAGDEDGTGTAAQFDKPTGVAVDSSGNVYVADRDNSKIRKITAARVVSTLAGTGVEGFADGAPLTAAQFDKPSGVAVHQSSGKTYVYVADTDNHRIRKIAIESNGDVGDVETLAGTGTAGSANGAPLTAAQFDKPTGVAVDSSGNIYVADRDNNKIRKITGSAVSTLASLTGGFDKPSGVAVDSSGNVYVADRDNNRIRKITATGTVSTLASPTGGFDKPSGVAVDSSGNVYVADTDNHLIRKIRGNAVSTLAGDGTAGFADSTGASAKFRIPRGMDVDSAGNVYVADADNHRIRKITGGAVSTLAGTKGSGFAEGDPLTEAMFRTPWDVAVYESSGKTYVYVADADNQRIRKITIESNGDVGDVGTLAGDGTAGSANDNTGGGAARFRAPTGVAVDSSGNVYVADKLNSLIRKITVAYPSGNASEVSTLAGKLGTRSFKDGTGTEAEFHYPASVAVDSAGNIYVADTFNHRIRKITPAGVVEAPAGSTAGFADGTGTAAQFNQPYGVAVDSDDNVYVADLGNNRIRKMTIKTENSQEVVEVSTLAGDGTAGFANGAAARFDQPNGVAVDSDGNVYVADSKNHRIRKLEYKFP